MTDTVLNANPTIRSATDLPHRQRPLETFNPYQQNLTLRRPSGLLSSIIPDSAYVSDPFASSSSTSSLSSTPSSPTLSTTPSSASSSHDVEPIDEQEVYDLIAPITDPEHPLTLASLSVINLPDISLTPLPAPSSHLTLCTVDLTPTITHCSLATVIGLGVRVRLEQALPPRFRVNVRIKEGTHSTAEQVTRQLGDKERVAAALENVTLVGVIRKMLEGCEKPAGTSAAIVES